jgi:hypothetical protein
LLYTPIDNFGDVARVGVRLGPGVALHVLGVDFRLRWGERCAEDQLRAGRIQTGFVGGQNRTRKTKTEGGRKMKENYEKGGKSEKEN